MSRFFNEGVDVNDFKNFDRGLDKDIYKIEVIDWYRDDLFHCSKPKRPTATQDYCVLSVDQLRDFEHAGWNIVDENNALKDFIKIYDKEMDKMREKGEWYSDDKFAYPHPIKTVKESVEIAVKTINEKEINDKLREYGYNERFITAAKDIIDYAEDILDSYNDSEVLYSREFIDNFDNLDQVFVRDVIDLIVSAYNKVMDETIEEPKFKQSNSYLPYPITEKYLSDEDIHSQYDNYDIQNLSIVRREDRTEDVFDVEFDVMFPNANHPDFNDSAHEWVVVSKVDESKPRISYMNDTWYPSDIQKEISNYVLDSVRDYINNDTTRYVLTYLYDGSDENTDYPVTEHDVYLAKDGGDTDDIRDAKLFRTKKEAIRERNKILQNNKDEWYDVLAISSLNEAMSSRAKKWATIGAGVALGAALSKNIVNQRKKELQNIRNWNKKRPKSIKLNPKRRK